MALETMVRGYLMSYWPDGGLMSSVTTINYGLIEVSFDEEHATDEDSKFKWSYRDIGSVTVKEPVDNVHKNAVALHTRLRQVLAANGKLVPDPFADKYCFMKLENIFGVEEAAKRACLHMMDDYLETKAKGSTSGH